MDIMFMLGFLLGLLTGAISITTIIAAMANKSIKRHKDKLSALTKDYMATSGIDSDSSKYTARLERVREIQERQESIIGQTLRPQRNSLDGKYQNRLNGELKALEEERNTILRSLLAEGFDPLVAVSGIDGTSRKAKLSEFMAEYNLIDKPVKPAAPPKRLLSVVSDHDDDTDDGGNGETTH